MAMQVIILISFCVWCYVGLVWFDVPGGRREIRALMFGVLRTVLWVAFRFLLYYASMVVEGLLYNHVTAQRLLIYAFLYLPTVWVEWSLTAALMTRRWSPVKNIFIGSSPLHMRWRALGTLMTVLLELPQSVLWQMLLRSLATSGSAALLSQ